MSKHQDAEQLEIERINAMSDGQFRTYLNRLRRIAGRQGLKLTKSRRRDPKALDYLHYRLLDRMGNVVFDAVDSDGYAVHVFTVERYLLR